MMFMTLPRCATWFSAVVRLATDKCVIIRTEAQRRFRAGSGKNHYISGTIASDDDTVLGIVLDVEEREPILVADDGLTSRRNLTEAIVPLRAIHDAANIVIRGPANRGSAASLVPAQWFPPHSGTRLDPHA